MMIIRKYCLHMIIALLVSLLVINKAVVASGAPEIVHDNFNLDLGDWSGYNAAIALAVNEKASGASSLKVTQNAAGGYPYLILELVPDSKYYFSCKVKSGQGVHIVPRLMLYNDVGNELLSIDLDSNVGVMTSQSSDGWTNIYTPDGFVFQPKIDYEMMIFGFVIFPADDLWTFWVDEVILSTQVVSDFGSTNPETGDSGRIPIYSYTYVLSGVLVYATLWSKTKQSTWRLECNFESAD